MMKSRVLMLSSPYNNNNGDKSPRAVGPAKFTDAKWSVARANAALVVGGNAGHELLVGFLA